MNNGIVIYEKEFFFVKGINWMYRIRGKVFKLYIYLIKIVGEMV